MLFPFPLNFISDRTLQALSMSPLRNFQKPVIPGFTALFFLVSFASAGQQSDSVFFKIADWIDRNAIGYTELEKSTRLIGHRLTGTENGRKAEEQIFGVLKSAGIDSAAFEPFDFSAWQRKASHLEIVPYRSDNFVDFESVSLANTASVSGLWHLVDAGDGLESDFRKLGERIRDKCVLLNLGIKDSANEGKANLHRGEKVSLALQYGAKALIFVHPGNKNQLLTGTASLKGEIVPVPALCISGPDGKVIRSWMQKERLMAEMRVSNPVVNGSARNVLAYLPATRKTRETIVFTAHLDSWDLASGATDNGLGAFTLLDIALALKPYRHLFKRNLIFVWTMGEEQGLLGSKHLVKKWLDNKQLDDVRLVINLDMVGNPAGFNAFSWPGMESALQDFNQKVKIVMKDYPGKISNAPGLHSDHQPFLLHGIPSVSGISNLPDSIYDCYHANCDHISLIRPQYLISSAKIHSMLGFELSTAKKLPFRSFSEKKLINWLKKTHLKEKLEISGEWRWN